MAPTTPPATPAQIEALLNFMEAHRDLARGLLRGADGRMRAKRLWEGLCLALNSMGSCTKTVEQWQRVWADKKHSTKKAAAASKRSACATGGGPSEAPTLSQVELKILSIMGEGFGEPQTEARVPAFPLCPLVESLPVPAATLPAHTSGGNPPAHLTDQPSQGQPSISTTEELELLVNSSSQQSQRSINSRRARAYARRHLSADFARRRIVDIEEQRLQAQITGNEELREIRVAIITLCNLLQQYITRSN